MLLKIQSRKAFWMGHILHKKCLLKHIIEGKTEEKYLGGRKMKKT
jgi:hypothetical protein